MTFLKTLLATAALVGATAAPAQLLGGGGAVGGMVGGTGGMVGGAGNIGGGFGNTTGNLGGNQLMTRAQRLEARQLRADRKAAERLARDNRTSGIAGSKNAGIAGSKNTGIAGSGNATGSLAGRNLPPIATGGAGNAGLDRNGIAATGNLAATAGRVSTDSSGAVLANRDGLAASGRNVVIVDRAGRVVSSGAIDARRDLRTNARAFADRREAVVAARGLRRIGRTASGVAVFVPPRAVAIAPVVVSQPYAVPVGGFYGGGDYYGGTVVLAGGEAGGYMDRQYRDIQQDVAGTGVTVERRGEDLVLQLPADITFAFDRSDIQPRFVPALDAVARSVAEYGGTDIEIVGHTDSDGSDAYNYALSQRRGVSVADFLVARNTAPDRLIVEALGETAPIASNASVDGRAANRRVEIILHPRAA